MVEFHKHVADVISAGAILGTLGHLLPEWAAIMAIVWYCIEIYESKTVQEWIRKRRLSRTPTETSGDKQ